ELVHAAPWRAGRIRSVSASGSTVVFLVVIERDVVQRQEQAQVVMFDLEAAAGTAGNMYAVQVFFGTVINTVKLQAGPATGGRPAGPQYLHVAKLCSRGRNGNSPPRPTRGLHAAEHDRRVLLAHGPQA